VVVLVTPDGVADASSATPISRNSRWFGWSSSLFVALILIDVTSPRE
jgi:hypothetical protein